MKVEFTSREAAEMVVTLRHIVDANFATEGVDSKDIDCSNELLISAIAKLCAGFGIVHGSPLNEATYDSLTRVARMR